MKLVFVLATLFFAPSALAAAEYVRLPWFLDVWVAIAILIIAFLIAALLNHVSFKARRAGALMCSLGLLLFVGVVLWVQIASLEEHFYTLAPWHDHIATWLQVFAIIAVPMAFFIAYLAFKAPAVSAIDYERRNTQETFGRVSRYLHWSIAILILFLIPDGMLTVVTTFDSGYRDAMFVVHKSLGFTVMILALVRLFWHRYSPKPPLSSELTPWEKFLAHAMHIMLYVFMFAWPISGYLVTTLANTGAHFYFIDIPGILPPEEKYDWTLKFAWVHSILLPYAFYVVFGLHVLGALKHHFVDKHTESIKRMLG